MQKTDCLLLDIKPIVVCGGAKRLSDEFIKLVLKMLD